MTESSGEFKPIQAPIKTAAEPVDHATELRALLDQLNRANIPPNTTPLSENLQSPQIGISRVAEYLQKKGIEVAQLPPVLQEEAERLNGITDKKEFAERAMRFLGDLEPVVQAQLPPAERDGFKMSYKVLQEGFSNGTITPEMIYQTLATHADPGVPQEEVRDMIQDMQQEFEAAQVENRMPDQDILEKKAHRIGIRGLFKTIMLILGTMLGFGVFKGIRGE